MDSFEWNKIAGGVLASVLLILGINTLGESLFHEEPLEQNAYVVEGVEEETTEVADSGATPDQGPSMAVLLATADPADGERLFRRCAACHSAEQGDPHRTGPNLWNTVGQSIASHDGFNYSAALQEFPGDWTFEHLDEYLADPKGYIPGNKMAFAGLKRAQDRAAVIAFLNTKTPNPLPLPEPDAEEGESDGEPTDAPAGEEATVPAPAADSAGDQELEVDEHR